MKSIHSFAHLLMGTLALSSLFYSGQIFAENLEETNAVRARHFSSSHREKCSKKPVFASFRSRVAGIFQAGQSIPFTITDVNKGNGVVLERNNEFFLIRKSGFYMINYGVSSSDLDQTIQGRGITLEVIHGALAQPKGAILVNSSQSIILRLEEGDRLRLFAQEPVQIIFGGLTTSYTDTAYITFMQLKGFCQ